MFSNETDRRVGTLDLHVVAVATVLSAVVLVLPVEEPPLLRVVVGLPLLLFLPGYALASALFPASAERTPGSVTAVWHADQRAISLVERLVISVVGSVAIVGAGAIAANAVVGVQLVAILSIVVAATLVAVLVAYIQRLGLSESRRFTPLRSVANPTGPTLPSTVTGWFLLAAATVALVVVAASGVAAMGADSDGVTEFYVAGESANGTVAMGAQPTELTTDTPVTHYLVVEQSRPSPGDYTVVAQLVGGEDTAAISSEIGRYQMTVNGTGHAIQPVEFAVDTVGEDRRVEYYLYEGAPPETPDRESALRYLGVNLAVSEG